MSQNLNAIANNRFNEIRKKLKLDLQKPLINKGIELTQEKLDLMMDSKHTLQKDELKLMDTDDELDSAVKEAEKIDETFEFIDSLSLPPKLSLAIALIISGNKTGNKQDFATAVAHLGEHLNEL